MSPFDADAIAREAVAPSGAAPDPKRPLFRPVAARTRIPHARAGRAARAGGGDPDADASPGRHVRPIGPSVPLRLQSRRIGDVELPGSGRRPLTGLFGSVAESGERKTTVDGIALVPVDRIEKMEARNAKDKRIAFVNDMDAWKAARETAKKKCRGDRAAFRDALNVVGPEPKAPPQAMLLLRGLLA